MQRLGGRPPLQRSSAPSTTRSPPLAASAAAALPAQRGLPRLHGGRARAHAGLPRAGRPLRGRDRLLAGGFVYDLVAPPRAAAHGDDPPDAPDHDRRDLRSAERQRARRRRAGGDRGEHGAGRGRPVRDGRRRRAGSPTTTSARARARARPRSGSTSLPVTQRRVERVHRRRRLRAARVVVGRGLGVAASASSATAPALLAARRRRLRGALASSALEPLDPRRPGLPRLLVRGGRLSRARGQAPAERGRVGEGRVVGRRPRGASGRYPWGDGPDDDERANLDQLAFGTAAGRRLSRPARAPCGAAADGWATSGSGRRAASTPTPASRRSPTASTRRSSSAGRSRCCAAAPGRRSPAP